MPLTPTDRAMLKFTNITWQFDGNREQAIRDRFGMSADVFALHLNRLIDTPDALAECPLEVNRLRRVRESRRRVGHLRVG